MRCSRPKRALDDVAEDYAVLVQEPEQLKRQVVKTAAKLPAGDRGDGPPEVAELRASWSGCVQTRRQARVLELRWSKCSRKRKCPKQKMGQAACRFNLTDATREACEGAGGRSQFRGGCS